MSDQIQPLSRRVRSAQACRKDWANTTKTHHKKAESRKREGERGSFEWETWKWWEKKNTGCLPCRLRRSECDGEEMENREEALKWKCSWRMPEKSRALSLSGAERPGGFLVAEEGFWVRRFDGPMASLWALRLSVFMFFYKSFGRINKINKNNSKNILKFFNILFQNFKIFKNY